jgi:hypothetical protein
VAQQVGSREWLLQLLDIAAILAVETGDWDWTLTRLDEVTGPELPTAYRLDYAATSAMIHTLRGDGEPLAALDRLGDPEPDLDPHALGWSRLARAIDAAVRADVPATLELTRSVAAQNIGFERAEALALMGRVAAWAGRADDAATALSELEAEPQWGRANAARLGTLRAAVQALGDGHSGDGSTGDPWEAQLATWRELGLPFREALCLSDRWFLRGDPADRQAATQLLESLGAGALIAAIQDREAYRS